MLFASEHANFMINHLVEDVQNPLSADCILRAVREASIWNREKGITAPRCFPQADIWDCCTHSFPPGIGMK